VKLKIYLRYLPSLESLEPTTALPQKIKVPHGLYIFAFARLSCADGGGLFFDASPYRASVVKYSELLQITS